jgi:hypothetical protein
MPTLRTSLFVGALFASTVLAQSPCFDVNLGTDLNLGDDSCSTALPLGFTFTYNGVPYTTVTVCSNGYIWLGSGTIADWSPTQAELLTGAPRICPLWMDFNPGAIGSGHVFANTPTPTTFTATWNNVYTFNTTSAGSMQITLDSSNSVKVTYGTLGPASTAQGGFTIIGASPGGGAVANPVSLATRPVTVLGTSNWPYSNVKMQWAATNPGYVISDVTCTPNSLPGPAHVDVLGAGCPTLPALNAGDDTTHLVTLPFSFPHSAGAVTQVIIASNGFLTLGPSIAAGSGCCSGVVTGTTGLLAGPPRISPFWTDLNESTGTGGNGEVYTGIEAGSGAFVVTWYGVGEFGVTPVVSNSFQAALYPNGDFALRYGPVSVSSAGHTVLAGYSHGNGAVDPGASDLSAIAAPTVSTIYETFTTTALPDLTGLNFLFISSGSSYVVVPGAGGAYSSPTLPLSLLNAAAPNNVPALGTTLTMDLSGISASPQGNVALLFIGFSELNPGVDLGAPLGAPGCTAFFLPGPNDMNFLNFTFGAPTTSFSVAVPNNTALIGAVGIAEAVSDDTSANAFGWKFSNGLRLTVGL